MVTVLCASNKMTRLEPDQAVWTPTRRHKAEVTCPGSRSDAISTRERYQATSYFESGKRALDILSRPADRWPANADRFNGGERPVSDGRISENE